MNGFRQTRGNLVEPLDHARLCCQSFIHWTEILSKFRPNVLAGVTCSMVIVQQLNELLKAERNRNGG